jgi:hypothetical protein
MAGKKKGKGSKPGHLKVTKETIGERVLVWNMSDEDLFCAATGAKLPKRGMVVRHNGKYYRNSDAARMAN